jgi:hypothetical protein
VASSPSPGWASSFFPGPECVARVELTAARSGSYGGRPKGWFCGSEAAKTSVSEVIYQQAVELQNLKTEACRSNFRVMNCQLCTVVI